MGDKIRNRTDIINNRIKELNSLYRTAANKSGISDGEISIWSILLRPKGEYSQQDPNELSSLSKQTVDPITSDLAKRGSVYLKHVLGIHNREVTCLTEEGLKCGTSHAKWIFGTEESMLEQTDFKWVQICIDMMKRYILLLKKEFNVE